MYQCVAGVDDKEACCPLSGRRCPEVVGGELERVIRGAATVQERSVFEDVMVDLSLEMPKGFVHEWHAGIASLVAGIVHKLTL